MGQAILSLSKDPPGNAGLISQPRRERSRIPAYTFSGKLAMLANMPLQNSGRVSILPQF